MFGHFPDIIDFIHAIIQILNYFLFDGVELIQLLIFDRNIDNVYKLYNKTA